MYSTVKYCSVARGSESSTAECACVCTETRRGKDMDMDEVHGVRMELHMFSTGEAHSREREKGGYWRFIASPQPVQGIYYGS